MQVSSTVGATSKLVDRLNRAIDLSRGTIGRERLNQLVAVQQKIDDFAQRGLLNRQPYSAATQTDFKRIYMRQP
jgi:hypothetical protein